MDCKDWLKGFLTQQGFVLVVQVKNAAKNAGFSKGALKIAKREIGVKTFHQFDDGEDTGNWFWYISEGGKNA